MLIYNTLSGKKEDLDQALGGKKKIRLFVCGPTVYDYSHIGHARIYIAFDMIADYLRSLGYKVEYIQNITDIDDKIIDRARKKGKTAKELAKIFTKEYLKDVKALDIKSVNKYVPASKHIKEIQKQIQQLMDKGYAYKTSSGVYFEVKGVADYGKLSKQNLDALRPGWRIELDPEKKDPLDFALWKFRKHDYEPSWKSPWGEGRPGWHIEDTAITEKYFGPQYDLHGGALDLKFPHHESEIAQQESASGLRPFVKIWMHAGFLLVGRGKMSKSLGNFITIRDFLKKYPQEVLRYIVMSHHYRSPIDYTNQLAVNAQNALSGIKEFFAKLMLGHRKTVGLAMTKKLTDSETKFRNAMSDDFNTPEALAAIFNLINDVNPEIWQIGRKESKILVKWVQEKLKILKIAVKLPKIPLKIRLLAKKRELFRHNKQFIQSDALRKQIESLGYSIEDTPAGALVLRK